MVRAASPESGSVTGLPRGSIRPTRPFDSAHRRERGAGLYRARSYHSVDYKTARFTQTRDELFPAYEVQLNAYVYVANRVGLGPVGGLSLIYMEPQSDSVSILEKRPTLKFEAKLVHVKQMPDRLIPPLFKSLRHLYAKTSPPRGREVRGLSETG